MIHAETTLNTTSPLTARDVYQVLKDVALGTRTMHRASQQTWNEIYNGLMTVEIDGWHLTLFNDSDTLDYCEDSERLMVASGLLKTGNAMAQIQSNY
jgi:hypothetical protein